MCTWISSPHSTWRARISPKSLIVAAACARPFVRAAAASGRRVIAADVFCDIDTRRAADKAIQLAYRPGGFDADDVRTQLLPLAAEGVGLAYGSGFETQPELLEELALHFQLFGNQPETVRITKDPGRFFSMLSRLGIPAPEVSMELPTSSPGWLTKLIGGSGGTHVMPATECREAGRYYQRNVPGQSVSLLFLTDGSKVEVVGYNLQLVAPLPTMPYRYGGAVSHFPLPENIHYSMRQAAEKITAELGLRGLNSLDCIVADEDFWVLEVNPRLSATFALYDAGRSGAALFEAHMQACQGIMPGPLPPEPSQAHLIYYAPFDLAVPAAMEWPDWVADVPEPASLIEAEQPLCTVSASATGANQALALARARVEELTRLVNNF